jgi:2-polyprenyl-6-hydroxyphenyl methylase / 3-demethylubiquinone-9 3-methyltransferase
MSDAVRNDLTIYDAAADTWWADDTRWVRTLRNLVPARLGYFDRFVDWNGLRVLDLGCAGGFMSEALHDRGAIVHGIDPAARAIDAARQHAIAVGKSIDYRAGVGEDLPYDDGSFDAVVCVDVLEHVTSLSGTVREIARVLKPGGWLMFDTINRNPLARFLSITVAEDLLCLLPRGTHDPGSE